MASPASHDMQKRSAFTGVGGWVGDTPASLAGTSVRAVGERDDLYCFEVPCVSLIVGCGRLSAPPKRTLMITL